MKVEDFSANRKPRAVTPSVKTINGYSKERALAWDNATTCLLYTSDAADD
mgnify:CR=1 FL=1